MRNKAGVLAEAGAPLLGEGHGGEVAAGCQPTTTSPLSARAISRQENEETKKRNFSSGRNLFY